MKLRTLAALLLLNFVLCGCSSMKSNGEVIAAAGPLIEKSYEVNKIYFGEGLEYSDESSIGLSALYAPVKEECGYRSTEDLKNAAREVYTEDYCQSIFLMAFEGYSIDEENAIYARYIDDMHDNLAVRKDLKETSTLAERTYDISTITVKKQVRNSADITVQSYVSGVKDKIITINMVLENGNWRLNSPTY